MQSVLFVGGLVLLVIGILLFGAGMILNARSINTEWFLIPGGAAMTAGAVLIAASRRF